MEKSINLSISGEDTQRLTVVHKFGSALFVLGILVLINGFSFAFLIENESSTIIGFALMYVGATLFTLNKKPRKKEKFVALKALNLSQKLGIIFSLLGMAVFTLEWINWPILPSKASFLLIFGLFTLGIGLYSYGAYAHHTAGIKNNHNSFNSFTARGVVGWIAGIVLTLFYIQLYWHGEYLAGVVQLFDPLSDILRGVEADKWFVYGSIYTFVILFLGIKFMFKYRHNRYQMIRTVVVIFSQLVFAYFLPQILEGLNYVGATDDAGKYLGYYSANPINSWPLNYGFFEPGTLNAYIQPAYQPVGQAYLIWGILLFLVVTPVLTYYVGKRWYCSWFCGCGGLAETAGDSFRQLSSKSVSAWKIERWVIHSIMVFVLLMTLAVLYTYFSGNEFALGFVTINSTVFFSISSILTIVTVIGLAALNRRKADASKYLALGIVVFVLLEVALIAGYFGGTKNLFVIESAGIKKAYGFFIGAAFSGVIGVGFYPILGNRVWCRFGCPMAGYMGIFQRFKSRFRITTNGGQCISCGNCSTYCEQGIDVRAYAQKGQNIVRSSCVGCGICSAVCPRGVLKLENGPEEHRISPESTLIEMLNKRADKN